MGVVSESVAYGFLVASYRRRMGLVAVREMARHRSNRQSQFVSRALTRFARLNTLEPDPHAVEPLQPVSGSPERTATRSIDVRFGRCWPRS